MGKRLMLWNVILHFFLILRNINEVAKLPNLSLIHKIKVFFMLRGLFLYVDYYFLVLVRNIVHLIIIYSEIIVRYLSGTLIIIILKVSFPIISNKNS